MRLLPRLRSLLLAGLCLGLLAVPAQATWSIILIDKGTGEVAIGSCTCLTNLDLEQYVPVMRVGIGGACAQSSIDSNATNRKVIFAEMARGTDPITILQILERSDPQHQSRQYGIVDLQGRAATFTGSGASSWAGGVTGSKKKMFYAIQGNILAGASVVAMAEFAVRSTPGDLAEKLMAGMEAAAAQGGDSRCNGAGKSADIGFMMISRLGDIEGGCAAGPGCADGSYYMNLNVANQNRSDPDPVIQLRALYNTWRAGLAGRPDHILSQATWTLPQLPGNGTSTTQLDLALVDVDGFPLTTGGAQVTVTHAGGSAGLSTIGAVVDNGNGTYSVPVTAGVGQGRDVFQVVVDDGQGTVQLYPDPRLVLGNTLDASVASLSASLGGDVDFTLQGPGDPLGRGYLLLASTSGTSPGLNIGGVVLPLNYDLVLLYALKNANGAVFQNTRGQLLPDGTGSARFSVPPGALNPLIGGTMSFAYVTLSPVDFPSNPVDVVITN